MVGSETKVKIVKNKVAPPFREVQFDIMYGEGISRMNELLILAEANGFIQKAGAWFSYEGTKIGQGKNNAIKWLKENPEIAEKIEQDIREQLISTPEKTPAGEQNVLDADDVNDFEDEAFNEEEL